jgi:VIT1/CCC1 family predicted Fe2+/Mn2+ transporter
MNIVLWVLQAALALLYVAGGAYKASSPGQLAGQFAALPPGGWRALGVLEVLGGLLLVVPAATGWMPALTAYAAMALAVETFALAALYARSSRRLSPENPMPWALVMGLVVAFVAYGRSAPGLLT